MKKYTLLIICSAVLFIACSHEHGIIDKANSCLEKAVHREYGNDASIADIDTIFTSKTKKGSEIFFVALKFNLKLEDNTTSRCEYIYQDIDGAKKEALFNLRNQKSPSIEEFANQQYREHGYNFHESLFMYAATKLAMFVREISND